MRAAAIQFRIFSVLRVKNPNIKIRAYKAINLPSFLYDCEALSHSA